MWKKTIKRFGLFLLAIVAIIVALTGCNNDGNEVTDSSAQRERKISDVFGRKIKSSNNRRYDAG